MKSLFALAAFVSTMASPAHAVYFRCNAPYIKVTIQPQSVSYSQCATGMATTWNNRKYCISKLSRALNDIELNRPFSTCTEFLTNSSGQDVARVDYAVFFGAE